MRAKRADLAEGEVCEVELRPLDSTCVQWLREAHAGSRNHVGAVMRDDRYWDLRSALLLAGRSVDLENLAPRYSSVFVGRAVSDSRTVGAALYEVMTDSGGRQTVLIRDLMASSTEAERALWSLILSLDLVDEALQLHGPLDTSLRWFLQDARRLECLGVRDHAWIRVVDVPAALASRSYRWLPSPVTLRVVDPLGISGDTTVTIMSDGFASSVERSTGEPDLTLTVSELGSLILGSGISGTRITALAPRGDFNVATLFSADGEPFADSAF